VFNGYMIF